MDVLGPVGLTLAHNQGVAFGLASGSDAPLIVFAVLALGFVGFLLARNPGTPGMWIAVGLVAGGALGNLIDRVRAGRSPTTSKSAPGRRSTSPTWRSPPASSPSP